MGRVNNHHPRLGGRLLPQIPHEYIDADVKSEWSYTPVQCSIDGALQHRTTKLPRLRHKPHACSFSKELV